MRKFLINIGLFAVFASVTIILLVLGTAFYTQKYFNFKIPDTKNILLVGNSRPEVAINDSVLTNVFNLAQSGSGYFYDYLKVREVTKHNPQIDTVVVGYSYGDLARGMDSWFTGKDKIKYKLRNYFFLMDSDDYLSLLQANPTEVLINTPQTVIHNIKTKKKGYQYLGGFKPLKENRLTKAKELIDKQLPDTESGYSQYQAKYLSKIYNYCNSKGIVLVLLSTPIHPLLREAQKPLLSNYFSFANENLPKAILVRSLKL